MTDSFSDRYGDLLQGAYDWVDRIVLNAYYPLGCNRGGVRVWWRQVHGGSDKDLHATRLMRMAGRFARRVRAAAQANGIPLIDCRQGERKHRMAKEYLATLTVGTGVFLILVGKAPARLWKVKRSASGSILNLQKTVEYVNHYSFHIIDPVQWVLPAFVDESVRAALGPKSCRRLPGNLQCPASGPTECDLAGSCRRSRQSTSGEG